MLKMNRLSYVALASLLMGQGAAIASQEDNDRHRIVIHSGRQSPLYVNIAFGHQPEQFPFQTPQGNASTHPPFLPDFNVLTSMAPRTEGGAFPQVSVSIAQPKPSSAQATPHSLVSFEALVQASLRATPPTTTQHQLASPVHPFPMPEKLSSVPVFQGEHAVMGQRGPHTQREHSNFTQLPLQKTSQRSVYLPSINTLEYGVSVECPNTLEGWTHKTKCWEELFAKTPQTKLTAYDLCAAAESYYRLSRYLEEGSPQFLDVYKKIAQCYADALKKESTLSGDVKKKLATACFTLSQQSHIPQEKLMYAYRAIETYVSLEKDGQYAKTETFYSEHASMHLLCASVTQHQELKAEHLDHFVVEMEKVLGCPSYKTAKVYANYAQALQRVGRQSPVNKKSRVYSVAAGFCDKTYETLRTTPEELDRDTKRDLALIEMKAAEGQPNDEKSKRLKRAYQFFKADVKEQHPDSFQSFEAISIIASNYAAFTEDGNQKQYYLKKASENSATSFSLNPTRDQEVYLRGARIQYDYALVCPEEQKKDVYLRAALWFEKGQKGMNNLMPASYLDAARANTEVLRRTQDVQEQIHFATCASAKYRTALEHIGRQKLPIYEMDLQNAGFANMLVFGLSQDPGVKAWYADEALRVYSILFTGTAPLSREALLALGHVFTEIGLYKGCFRRIETGVTQFEKLYQEFPTSLGHFGSAVQKATRYLAENSAAQYKVHYYQNHALWCDHSVNSGLEDYSYDGIYSYVQAGNWTENPEKKRTYYSKALERAMAALSRIQNPDSYHHCVIGSIRKCLGETHPAYSEAFYQEYEIAFESFQKALQVNQNLPNNFYRGLSAVQSALQYRKK
ncbi:MAG: hypothetical protein H2057_02415 [Alphaproteobacteria bacterium]|nr:hypothetical protein [Alphaproteobacteria bacterium]